MPGTYVGSWLRNAYRDPAQAVLHTSDPSHDQLGQLDQTPIVHQAPPLLETAPIGLYPGAEWVTVTPGHVLNSTPVDHTQGAPAEGYATELESQTANQLAHAVDLGGPAQSSYYEPPLQFADEVYSSTRFEGLDSTPIADVALRRGLNGDPVNNPDGFRRGYDNYWWVTRKFAVPPAGDRMHDAHILTPNTATAVTNVPPTPVSYGSPFDSLARNITNTFATPSVRREPPDLDTGLPSDGLDDMYAASDPWVVG